MGECAYEVFTKCEGFGLQLKNILLAGGDNTGALAERHKT